MWRSERFLVGKLLAVGRAFRFAFSSKAECAPKVLLKALKYLKTSSTSVNRR